MEENANIVDAVEEAAVEVVEPAVVEDTEADAPAVEAEAAA